MKIIAFLVGLLCSGCVNPSAKYPNGQAEPASLPPPDTTYTWTQLLESAPWQKSYNFQLFSMRDTLWTFHPDGTWWSANGINWEKSPLPNAIGNLAFLDYVYFKNDVLGLGNLEGNIEQNKFSPEIYLARDGKSWDTLSKKSTLPARFFYHPFVFDHKIWIIGGEDKEGQYSDIWNSKDGINWIKIKENLPFGNRSGSQVVYLNDSLYLLNNDVWRSKDWVSWEKISDEIVKGEKIFGYGAVVLDQHIWLIGCNRNGQFTSQVLYSSDGVVWKSQQAPWLPRGGVAVVTHKNNIYMTGGKYGGTPNHPEFRYDNDVWVMEINSHNSN